MKILATFLWAFLAMLFFPSCKNNAPKADYEKMVIAYVFPGNRLLLENEIDATKLTHINYAFANIINNRVVEGFVNDSANLATLVRLREQHPHLKILISVGGWTWSGMFSDMALTAQTRAVFIESAIEFVKKHRLDGLDIDWEFPGLPGNNNIHRPVDKQNFTALMRETRKALDEASTPGQPLLLTIAAGAFNDYLLNTEMNLVEDYLDFVNIMTYDFHGEWNNFTGHHANLSAPAHNPQANSMENSVNLFLKAGVPAEKIVVGVAFYGRGWNQVGPLNNGLGQPARGLPDVDLNYHNIVRSFLTNPAFEQHFDTSASAPFLWNPTERIFITYEDPRSIQAKAAFVKENNLGGAMFWQYFGDYQKELLTALYDGLNSK